MIHPQLLTWLTNSLKCIELLTGVNNKMKISESIWIWQVAVADGAFAPIDFGYWLAPTLSNFIQLCVDEGFSAAWLYVSGSLKNKKNDEPQKRKKESREK